MNRILHITTLAVSVIFPSFSNAQGSAESGVDSLSLHAVPIAETPDLEARDLIGARVYMRSGTPDQPVTDIAAEWEDIGELRDILVTSEGETSAALIDVGGFLGIGETTVAIDLKRLGITPQVDGSGWLVAYFGTQETLEELPQYEVSILGMPKAEQGEATEVDGVQTQQERDAEKALEAWLEGDIRDTPAPEEAMNEMPEGSEEKLSAAQLTGAPVYDRDAERVGDVDHILLDDAGEIDRLVIGLGGGIFGLGEKPVAVAASQAEFEGGAEAVAVHLDLSSEALERMPVYDE